MNLEEIKSLIDMLEGTDITEFKIEEEDIKINIKKGQDTKLISPQEISLTKEQKHNEIPGNQVKLEQTGENIKDENQEEFVSPMVGTFYRSPAPDAKPFVKKGDIIQKGDTLCIIEAMKLMNEIEAETDGKIKEILVQDAEPVEYGQPLFIIENV